MKLEPYTVPEQDADLWGCGVVLDPSPSVEIRAANDRPAGRDHLVWAVMCEHETATFAGLVEITETSPRRVGTSLMRLASLGTVRPVGEVELCSNNGVSVRSRWTLCGPEERQAAGAAWRDRVMQDKQATAEARGRWEALAKAEREAEWEAGGEGRRAAGDAFAKAIGDGTIPVRTLPGGVRVVGSALPPTRSPSPPKPKLSAAARAAKRAEAAADAKASEESAEERRRQDEFEASRRARINGWTT